MPILLVAGAGLVAYWSRTKPVEVTVVYDLGKNAPRASRLTVSFRPKASSGGATPVTWEFPAGSEPRRRHRHQLHLKPGSYEVRARLSLRALGDRPAEVRRIRRTVEIASGRDQRITLRFR